MAKGTLIIGSDKKRRKRSKQLQVLFILFHSTDVKTKNMKFKILIFNESYLAIVFTTLKNVVGINEKLGFKSVNNF